MCEYFLRCSCNVQFYSIPKIPMKSIHSLLQKESFYRYDCQFVDRFAVMQRFVVGIKQTKTKDKRYSLIRWRHNHPLPVNSSQFLFSSNILFSSLLSEFVIHFLFTTKTATMNSLRFYSRILNLTEWMVAWYDAMNKTKNILIFHRCKNGVFLQLKSLKQKAKHFFFSPLFLLAHMTKSCK